MARAARGTVLSRWGAVSLCAAIACGPKAPAEAPPATQPPAARVQACSEPPARSWVYTVDWDAEHQRRLQAALVRGIAVARYDCTSLELVEGCSAAGDYAYLPVTPRNERFRLASGDELRANLPASGGALRARLGQAPGVDVELAVSGESAAAVGALTRRELRGECAGATHFVKSVEVGAGTLRAVSGAATSGAALNQLGNPAACATPGAGQEPRAECGAALRLELIAVTEEPSAAADPVREEVELAGCPPPLVMVEGVCKEPDPKRAYLCGYGRGIDCQAQCGRGDAASCTRLGLMYERGTGVVESPAHARSSYEKACQAGHTLGCVRWADLLLEQEGSNESLGLELYRRACAAGQMRACSSAAAHYQRQTEGGTPATEEVALLLDRACRGGDMESCAGLIETIDGAAEGSEQAVRAAVRACAADNLRGCTALATAYLRGRGVEKNPARAAELYSAACERDHLPACGMLGTMYIEGGLGPPEPERGFELLDRACALGDAPTCFTLGLRYDKGEGVLRDPVRARVLFERACRAGMLVACE